MNYYDEEITLNGPDTKHLGVKVNRLPNGSIGSGLDSLIGAVGGSTRTKVPGKNERSNRTRPRNMFQGISSDDDGLLQGILDHDDDDDDDDDEDDDEDEDDDSDTHHTPRDAQQSNQQQQRPQTRPGSTRILDLPSAKAVADDTEASESESDDGVAGAIRPTKRKSATGGATSTAGKLNLKPENWDKLAVPQEVKDIFPYLLKYTPQHIETPFHLQPFIPDFVPAVGDVDAFLKVTIPTLLQPQRQNEVNEHLHKMGLFVLDEPSGEQSVPSLLNMKLRSVLTGSGAHANSASTTIIPTAKSLKDIDKWIAEVEQVHMTQSVYDAQPRKDIDPLLLDWPRSYADAGDAIQGAYQRCRQEDKDTSLTVYIRVLCERFGIEGPLETQSDYILNIQTLFALYLAANQAWE